jgi:hypothetical protein
VRYEMWISSKSTQSNKVRLTAIFTKPIPNRTI